MGSASSIENAAYDPAEFQQSKAVMESAADDAEKFAELKHIWTEQETAAKAAASAGTSDEHKKSTDELPPVAAEASHTPHAADMDHAKPSEHKDAAAAPADETNKDEHHHASSESKKDEHKPAAQVEAHH